MGRKRPKHIKRDPYWSGAILAAIALFFFSYFMFGLEFFLSLALSMSFVSVGLYITDKLAARSGNRRAPEPLLMFSAISGGGIGAFLAMVILPHKKNKGSFWAVNLFSAVMWTILILWDIVL